MRRIDLIVLKFKELSVNVLLLLFVVCLFFVFGEIIVRVIYGGHIFGSIEDNGLYHYEPNQEGWYDFRYPVARINNLGLRGPDVDVNLPVNKYVFLGDSFMFGWSLEDNETIPSYFRSSLNLSEDRVINLGIGGYGVDHMIERYDLDKGLFRQGDVFIMNIIHVDFFRKLDEYNPSFAVRMYRNVKRHSSLVAYLRLRYHAAFGNIIYKLFNAEKQKVTYPEVVGVDAFDDKSKNRLLDFNHLVEGNNQSLIFVFYEFNYTNYSRDAGLFCMSNDLNCIVDVPSYIDEIRGSKPVRAVDVGHPSRYSNEVVARGIADYVADNDFDIFQ